MSDSVDQETLDYLRSNIAREYELPATMSHRLKGVSVTELRQDADALRGEIGLPPFEGEGDVASATRKAGSRASST
jgi:hypothetical protein